MKKLVAFNADGTYQLIIVRGVFKKRFFHVVPGVGLVELHVEQLNT